MADINFTRDGSTNLSPAPASTQQYVISKAGLQAIAAATYTYAVGPTDAQGETWQTGSGPKHIRLYKGDGSSTIIGVGSDINFQDSNGDEGGACQRHHGLPQEAPVGFAVDFGGEVEFVRDLFEVLP